MYVRRLTEAETTIPFLPLTWSATQLFGDASIASREPWSAVIGENAGDFKHNRPRGSPQNGDLETILPLPQARKTAIETGYGRFRMASHISPITRGLMTTWAETFGDSGGFPRR